MVLFGLLSYMTGPNGRWNLWIPPRQPTNNSQPSRKWNTYRMACIPILSQIQWYLKTPTFLSSLAVMSNSLKPVSVDDQANISWPRSCPGSLWLAGWWEGLYVHLYEALSEDKHWMIDGIISIFRTRWRFLISYATLWGLYASWNRILLTSILVCSSAKDMCISTNLFSYRINILPASSRLCLKVTISRRSFYEYQGFQ